MYVLAKRLLQTDKKKTTKVHEYRLRSLAEIKTPNSLQIIKLGQRFFLLVRHFVVLSLKEILFYLFIYFFCTVISSESAFAQCIYGTAGPTQCAKSFKT